jgi:hypothetical protein
VAERAVGGAAAEVPHEVFVASEFVADGEAAMAGGDHAAAVRSFRKAVFVDPDDETHHIVLAGAFEASGDAAAAVRSANAARAARRRLIEPERVRDTAADAVADAMTPADDASPRAGRRGEARAR